MAKNGSKRIGTYVTSSTGGEKVRAYIPPPLPPDPPLNIGPLYNKIEAANRALGRLDGVTSILPDTPLFLYMYVRKEALLSSQIEGTQSSLSDLLLYENDAVPDVPIDDVQEVSNYVAAMHHGLERLRTGIPISNRLLRSIHSILLSKGRGSRRDPGEFRRTQNWIGGTRPGNALFVPPPPEIVADAMSVLVKFVHDDSTPLPLLVRAALAHAQFASIHAFLDSKGRLDRVLVALMLQAGGALKEPVLYLSLYLKIHRQAYYDHLQKVRTDGDWESWLGFFLEGVQETSDQAAETAKAILDLFEEDRKRIEALGRPAGSALQVHQYLQTKPIISVSLATQSLPISAPTIRKSIGHLVDLGLIVEITGKRRDKMYVYDKYVETLSHGTVPLR